MTEPVRRKAGSQAKNVDAQLILDTAAALLERDGVAGFSMRGLSEHLGVAVTSIYWHVGGRDKLFDHLIDRLIEEMASLPAAGDTPLERIAALARAQRTALIERQHLMVIAHERDRTPSLFQPVQQILAAELAELGIEGTRAALALRSIEVHVISSALMQFSSIRSGEHEEEDASLWGTDWPDRELVEALRSPTDYDAVFEYGLAALLASLNQ
ncbi:TetR/AcrR family transcriptional regulator [Mycobacterium sp. OTB74]|jgi:AcrR family transcriptional regulator|uniref:TetR/AcrR family transcriptional regulator n=1 Tax=Mycobacterium sp. OTB74 TaxID=1853452 RepID=UPI0024756C3B|nr:TetR/AcrR family transcriptional regulator [Mycobacterium sp. OTB74]MDH6244108.1 TetR/AcrR family tetracycline transcriptional repressor [Mycobacterium sp. OTB74]